MGNVIGKQSTYKVRCAVCDQTFGNAQRHDCQFSGVEHANMHRAERERILMLERELLALTDRVRALESVSVPSQQACDGPPSPGKVE